MSGAGWQKLCGGTGGPRRKDWTWTKILSQTYAILSRIKISRDLLTFWRSLGKRSAFFWVKTVLLGQEVHYYIITYIAYFTELNLQLREKTMHLSRKL